MTSEAFVPGPGEVRTIELGGFLMTVKATAESTDDAFTLLQVDRASFHGPLGSPGQICFNLGDEPASPDGIGGWRTKARSRSGIDKRWRLHDLRSAATPPLPRLTCNGVRVSDSWPRVPGARVPDSPHHLDGGEAAMTGAVRRVVTGHDKDGHAVFVSDELVEPVMTDLSTSSSFHVLWNGDTTASFPDDGSRPAFTAYFPPVGGFRFGLFSLPPRDEPPPAPEVDVAAAVAELRAALPGLLDHMESGAPGMHTTATIDFEVVQQRT